MPSPPARRARPRRRRATWLPVAVLLVAAALAGCSQDEPAPAPEASPTPLANLNTRPMRLPRIEFCKLVPDDAVREALGARPDDAAAWGNGDEEAQSGVSGQVLHELGCAWRTSAGAAARAWVYARPVDRGFAAGTVRASERTRGCRTVGGPPFGDPSYTQVCRLASGEVRARHAGLFGQTWLTCEVAQPSGSPDRQVRQRADAWCVEVANSLNTDR